MSRQRTLARPLRQPVVTVGDLSDPTTVHEDIDVIEQDVVQLQSQSLHVRRVIVRLEGSLLVFHASNLRMRSRTRLQSGLVGFVAFGPRAKGTINGLPIRTDVLLAAEPGMEIEFVVEGGYESVCVLTPPGELSAHLAGRQRQRDVRLPRGIELLQSIEAEVRKLFDWGQRFAEAAALHPERFNSRVELRTAARVQLLETLLSALHPSSELEPSRRDHTRQAYSRMIQKAEHYALANAGEPMYVTDLCRAAGASERSLQYAFKDVLNMTPVAFLTRLRLHRARQALRAAAPGSTTVTAEALTWGFWHFGEFSRAYKSCFGERPSDTLRRRESASAPTLVVDPSRPSDVVSIPAPRPTSAAQTRPRR